MKGFFTAAQPSRRGMLSNSRRKRLILSYLPDWILTIAIAAIFLSLNHVEGYRRQFSLTDSTLHYPYALHERVPTWLLYVICLVAPFCIMPIVNFFTVRSWWDFHNSSLGLILSLALTGAFTQVVKITVGAPRPDILARCQPPTRAVDPTFRLTDWTVCTQTDKAIMMDGWRSFFSGHSSMSFAGLGFLSFYLAGKLHLFDRRGHTGKAWLSLAPFMAAALVAISRTMDYRHHWQDVLIGGIVGTVLAYFAYRQYYPDLGFLLSHRPYSPRIKEDGDRSALPTHNGNGESKNGGHQRYNNGDPDLAGTVPRSGPRHLADTWREGSDGSEVTVPGATANPNGRSALVRNHL